MMANGEMTRMLVHTDVTRYLEFKQIAGSYVFRDGRISKVPSTEMEAVRSPLMGLFEKRRAKKFFEWVQNYKADDPSTHQGQSAFQVPVRDSRFERPHDDLGHQVSTSTRRPWPTSITSLAWKRELRTLLAMQWLSTSMTGQSIST